MSCLESTKFRAEVRSTPNPDEVAVVSNPAADRPYFAGVDSCRVAEVVSRKLARERALQRRHDNVVECPRHLETAARRSVEALAADKDAHHTIAVETADLALFGLDGPRHRAEKHLKDGGGDPLVLAH